MSHPRRRATDRITKAVIPAAGLGTRFLPATKATPKEMLPVVDKPAIQYVVEEAVAAGLHDVLMVTGRNKRPLEDHFDRAAELEEYLTARGEVEKLKQVQEATEVAQVHYVRQGDPRGLGHAVLAAEGHVGDVGFAVLLGDDLIDARDQILPRMIDLQEEFGGAVVALMEVPKEVIHLYGCVAVDSVDGDVVRINDLVEKPEAKDAPSNLAIIGRYVLGPEIFDVLRSLEPGRGGEIQLTDALKELVRSGKPVHGVIFRGRRYDTGDRIDYLKTVIRVATDRDDIAPELIPWLKDFVRDL